MDLISNGNPLTGLLIICYLVKQCHLYPLSATGFPSVNTTIWSQWRKTTTAFCLTSQTQKHQLHFPFLGTSLTIYCFWGWELRSSLSVGESFPLSQVSYYICWCQHYAWWSYDDHMPNAAECNHVHIDDGPHKGDGWLMPIGSLLHKLWASGAMCMAWFCNE